MFGLFINRKALFFINLTVFAFFHCHMVVAFEPSLSQQQEKVKQFSPIFDSFISTFLKKKKSPGCVVAIVGPQSVYFLKAYGVKELGKHDPLTQKTVFQLGSASKPISSTLVAVLQAQNKLSIESPVTLYLKDFKLNGQTKPLLIKHLLSHTSGLPRYGFNALIEASATRNSLYMKAQNIPIASQPGEAYDYHNVMFSLIEDILKASTNEPFAKLLKQHLFDPLQMKSAFLTYAELKEASDRATPHTENKKGNFVPVKNYSKTYYTVTSAGGINASMEDLVPFLQLHLGGFPNLLGPEQRKGLYAPQVTEERPPYWLKNASKRIEKTGYSLGWRWMDYAGERVVYHGGWLKGFHAMIAFLPQYDIGLIVLDNAETNLTIDALVKFLDLYLTDSSDSKR